MSVPLWIRNVISLCNAQGGRITGEEIAYIAATVKIFDAGPTLVTKLRRNKHVLVEVVGETMGQNRRKVKIYRITRCQ